MFHITNSLRNNFINLERIFLSWKYHHLLEKSTSTWRQLQQPESGYQTAKSCFQVNSDVSKLEVMFPTYVSDITIIQLGGGEVGNQY